jgi:hypothetical protein
MLRCGEFAALCFDSLFAVTHVKWWMFTTAEFQTAAVRHPDGVHRLMRRIIQYIWDVQVNLACYFWQLLHDNKPQCMACCKMLSRVGSFQCWKSGKDGLPLMGLLHC